jgi:hypothetical protein
MASLARAVGIVNCTIRPVMQGALRSVSDELKHIYIEVARPRGTFTGKIEECLYADLGDEVQLYSMQKRSWGKKFRRKIPEGLNARETAALLLRSMLRRKSDSFSRKLYYPPGY